MLAMVVLSVLAAVALGGLVTLLVELLIIGIIAYAVILIIGMLPIPPNLKTIVWLIVAVVVLVAVLELFLPGTVGLR